MRSLLISKTYFPPQVGGISRMMEEVCLTLGPARVSCLTGVRESRNTSPKLAPISIYRRPRIFDGSLLSSGLSMGLLLARIAMGGHPQVVQLATCDDGNLGLFLKRWFGLPFVIYAHGNEILAAMDSDWDSPRLALRNAACVMANSSYTANQLQKIGVAPEAIEIIPLGCDAENFRPKSPNKEIQQRVLGDRVGTRVILTVGGLVERKGHDMIIRALAAISESVPDVTYLIVGAGPFSEKLQSLATELGVRDKVIFAGRIPDEELADMYAMCDVFAMPSRTRLDSHDVEGFGLVYLEAAACAKPVVAGRSGGIEDAVENEVTGLVVDPSDAQDVGAALTRLLTDSELKDRLGRQGRTRVEEKHTWSIMGARVEQILERVVSNGSQTMVSRRRDGAA